MASMKFKQALPLAAGALLSLAACGGSATVSTSSTSASTSSAAPSAPASAPASASAQASSSSSARGAASESAKPAASGASSAASASAASSPAASTSPAGSAPAGNLTKIKFATGGNPPDPAFITAYIARDAGFFQKNGLDVDVQSVQGDQLVTASLVSGEIQFGEVGVAAGMAAVSQGGNLRFVVAGTPKLDQLLVVSANIKQPTDLQGKGFGISQPGSVSDASGRLMLQKLGVDLSKVDFLPLGGIGNRAKALAAGQIAGSGVPNLVYIQLHDKNPDIHSLGSYADQIPDFMYVADMARTDWLAQHDKEASAFVKSIMQAARYINTNESDAIA